MIIFTPHVTAQSELRLLRPQKAVTGLKRRAVTTRAVVAQPQEAVQTKKPSQHGRLYNFSAGPAVLPVQVLEQAQADLLNWQGCGISVLEMSHRGKEFAQIIAAAEADLRALLDIPENYQVLFLQGGASTQFAAIPLNLTQEGDSVDYVVTGSWSKKAAEEAKKYGLNVNIAAKGDGKSIPGNDTWKLTSGAKYVHYCDNETIGGVEFKSVPEVGDVPLIADMSSNFLSKPVDVSKYGIIYAGAQKNVGPAGVTMVIVRDDLMAKARTITPSTLDYEVMKGSLYNTPPAFAIYMCGLVFAKMLREGGLAGMQEHNRAKAKLVYDAIEESQGFYANPVELGARSLMNVPFTIPSSADLEKKFISEAAAAGMVQLKGHRSVGGMRASIYNSMPMEGIELLASFMKEFAAKHS